MCIWISQCISLLVPYFYKGHELIIVIALFIDDLTWAGKHIFNQKIDKLKNISQMGSENQKAFTYVGINLKQNQDHLIMTETTTYTEYIQLMPMTKEQITNPHCEVT